MPTQTRHERIVVQNDIPVLDTGLFEQMQRIAKVMANSNLVPEHLNRTVKSGGQVTLLSPEEALANCFLVVNQSVRWKCDPFAVAQHVFVTKGRVGYEGKLVAAVVNSHPNLAERLSYEFHGTPGTPDRKVVVSGRVKGDTQARTVEGTVKQWATANDSWKNIPDQMLTYRGAREWARRWMPEAVLGVYADEEIQQVIEHDITPAATPQQPERSAGVSLRAAVAQPHSAPSGQPVAMPEADPIPETGQPAPDPVVQRTTAKEPGTPRLRKVYLGKLEASTDLDTLALIYDEVVSLYDWPEADANALADAYNAKLSAAK
jgi:hypothetical protein